VEERVRAIIVNLEQLDRTYFGRDRVKQIRDCLDATLAILDSKPIDLVQNKKEKAELLYLRGRTLDFLPEYTKQAEDLLSKSLKLIPTKREAWDALGHVYWKKNDLAAAKNCFESSLEQEANNKEIIRNLSMVLRQ
jgi:lipoprotein NlpI